MSHNHPKTPKDIAMLLTFCIDIPKHTYELLSQEAKQANMDIETYAGHMFLSQTKIPNADTLNAMREVTEDNLPSYDSLDEMMVDVYAKI